MGRPRPSPTPKAPPPSLPSPPALPQTFLTAVDWAIVAALTAVSLGLRLSDIGSPSRVVFDEVHFGKFANYYLRGTYFFDLHPPLAKLLLAALGRVLGYDGSYPFYAINDSYVGWSVPYVAMRSVSAVEGGLLAPLAYWILRELNVGMLPSLLAATMVCFDNALITMSRFILLDAQLLFPIIFTTLSWIKFAKYDTRAPFSTWWWFWLATTGFSLGVAISMKSIGVLIVALVGVFTVEQLVRVLLTRRLGNFFRHFSARALCLIALPLSLFVFFFWIHFLLLPKTGPGDAFMSFEIQAELLGNSYTVSPKAVGYGSTVTIRNVNCEGYLSANDTAYPIFNPKQSVVSGSYARRASNYWVVVPAEPNMPRQPVPMIKNGSKFRLKNNETNLYLYSDKLETVFPSKWMHVSAVEKKMAKDDRSVWSIHYKPDITIDNGDMLVQFTQFRLMNEFSKGFLVTHPRTLPDWGNELYETGATYTHDGLLWVVIEHDHPKLPHHPPIKMRLSFFTKLIELIKAMNFYNSGLVATHPWQSTPKEWAVLHRGISFWSEAQSEDVMTQVYLLGNPLVWWMSLVALVAYILLLAKERAQGSSTIETADFLEKGRFMLVAWFMHYIPFFTMERCLFLHHYFAAFVYSVFIAAIVYERLTRSLPQHVQIGIVFGLCAAIIGVFWFFSPLTYGWPMTNDEIKMRKWLPAWDFAHSVPTVNTQ